MTDADPVGRAGAEPIAEDAVIELRRVDKTYGKTPVIENLNLQIRRGEFLTLLGPSGCGKTTTLKMVAGFEPPTRGEIV
ncbi:MAG TPA: ATP-binding cassette domain-containing protein, partial [Gammaproteobacteria bacterium]|nr:ATP-binding cassette domain-containing protein [Gammaproteobacteria bacterium]